MKAQQNIGSAGNSNHTSTQAQGSAGINQQKCYMKTSHSVEGTQAKINSLI